ncbi:hypothetical protein FOZG_13208 [Fusarium oxysporum Fo47]|uniref:Uncharacterized protein n=2 Tax=Fusarium oxysporum TaxID=5507 RepID=W9JSH3_FUSOX|nr:hypothetical protein FOZG_13208 [Fusarium oxysporum Fo47]
MEDVERRRRKGFPRNTCQRSCRRTRTQGPFRRVSTKKRYEQNNENILEFLTRKRKADGIYFRSMKYLGTRWTCFVFEGCCYTQPDEAYEQLETRIAKRAQYIAKHAAENKTGGQPPTTPKIKSKSARKSVPGYHCWLQHE